MSVRAAWWVCVGNGGEDHDLYAKVFSQIFDSSIAENYLTRLVFTDLLTLADVNGVVDMTHEAIARRTNVPLETVCAAIAELESPDPKSRTPDEDGRRITRLDQHRDWGWMIVNYQQFREIASEEQRRAKTLERVRKHRGKEPVTPCNAPVTPVNACNAMQMEREKHKKKERDQEFSPSPPIRQEPIPKERIEGIHSFYSEQMGGEVKLDFATERIWYEWFNAGHVEDDFKRVFKYVRDGIGTGERNRGALKLSNLLQPDKFGEDLLISKQALPTRGENGGKISTKSIAEKDLDRMLR